MDIEINRVAQEIVAWRKQEEQISNLFPPAVVKSRDFQKEKLRRLDTIYASYKPTAGTEEMMTLRLLKTERNQLEEQLYPRLLQKLFRKAQLGVEQRKMARQATQTNDVGTIQQFKSESFAGNQHRTAGNMISETNAGQQLSPQRSLRETPLPTDESEPEGFRQKQSKKRGLSL